METSPFNFRIVLNCQVSVALVDVAGDVEERVFTVVAAQQADFKAGLLGENTPLGRALFGHVAGDVIPYRVGDLREVRVLAVKAKVAPPISEAAEHRRAVVRQAANQSEITNQMIFATASGSKWGDYEVNMDEIHEAGPGKDAG